MTDNELVKYYLFKYLEHRPLFLSLIRAKEAELYHKYLPLKGSVLDVGCGDGFFAKTVFHHINVGLDVKNSRIIEADKQGVYQKIITYDGNIFPFKSNLFSTVISNCVLEHIPNLPKLLSEIYRVLKPGGTLLTTVMAKPWEDYLFGSKIIGNRYQGYMRKTQVHLNMLSKAEWDKQFIQSGFKVGSSIGYLNQSASQIVDICHYISIPSLICYKLTGLWVIHPTFGKVYPVNYLAKMFSQPVDAKRSGAIFYELEKK
jgi:ubiquinone/menaquinone biosynthesis C-methylase UbiE